MEQRLKAEREGSFAFQVRRHRFDMLDDLRPAAMDERARPAMLTVSVQEYDIADVRPVFGKGSE